MNIGVFGGTFNPPHLGHLLQAQEAYEQLSLDQVVFVPNGIPPHRKIELDPGKEARLLMTLLACAEDDRYEVSDTEYRRKGFTYMVDTLREIHEGGDLLHLIMGADQALTLPAWKDPDKILDLARLVVCQRNGIDQITINNAWRGKLCRCHYRVIAGRTVRHCDSCPLARVDYLEASHSFSSTEIRERVRQGSAIRYMVPDSVEIFIDANKLYREDSNG